jgi:hypothetical protein
MNRDDGHSVERCQSGLSAATALAVCADDNRAFSAPKRHYNRLEDYWREQLRYAQGRVK